MIAKLRLALLWLSVLLMAVASSARAATLGVGPGQPYTTIQSAINAASSGDTVLVAPGTYFENINFHGKAVTVTSSGGPANTIIDGGNVYGTASVTFDSGELRTSVISNFTIRNGGGLTGYYSAGGGGVFVGNAAPTVQGNTITGNTCVNVYLSFASALITGNDISAVRPATSNYPCDNEGVFVTGNANVGTFYRSELIGNTIENNTGGYGLLIDGANSALVQSNIIRYNSGKLAGGVGIFNTDSVYLLQNLVYGNTDIINGTAQPLGISLLAPYSTVGPFIGIIASNTIADSISVDGNLAQFLIVNNIFAASSASTPALQCPPNLALEITPPSFDHNLLFNSAGPAFSPVCQVVPGTYGNLVKDPQFLAPSSGNYQVANTSPALDNGNNSSPFILATDLAGAPRITATTAAFPLVPAFATIDIGAYESAGSPDLGHTILSLTPSEYFSSSNPTPAPPPLSFTVTLGSATGNVAIYEDTTLLGTVNIQSAAPVTFTPTSLAAGTHSFTAVYPAPQSGLQLTSPAVSPRFYLLVPQNLTTLSLTSSSNPSAYQAPVTFTITESAGNGSNASPITLTDTSTNTLLATLIPNAAGVATYSSSSLTPGTHTLVAALAATQTQSSASATFTQIVNPVPSLAQLLVVHTAFPPSPYDIKVVVTGAQFTPLVPTGTISFFDGSTLLGTSPLAGGFADLSLSTLATGPHNLTCIYSGDMGYLSSNCNILPYTVVPAGPQPQTITFPALKTPAYDATSVGLLATATSGLPITYTVLSGPATVTGNVLTYTGLGLVTVQAAQAGGAGFSAATPVTNTVTTQLVTEPLGGLTEFVTVILFKATGILSDISVTTQGAPSLDFFYDGRQVSTCERGAMYAAGQTCFAQIRFIPTHPGPRFGGITLTDAQGNLLASSYLLGEGIGPQLFYLPATQSTISGGFGYLSGAAVDGSGNLYLSDKTSGISQVNLATGASRNLNPLPGAADVIVDGSGNLFAIDDTRVVEIPAVDGTIPANPTLQILATGFYHLDGVKVDSNGDIFVADGGDTAKHPGSVTELLAVNGVIPPNPVTFNISFAPGASVLTGVAVDINGDVFASDQQNHAVFEALAVNGSVPPNPTIISVGSGFLVPTNVAFDGIGDLFVPDAGTHSIREVLAVNGSIAASPAIVDLGSGLVTPQGLVVDPSGNVFIADSSIAQVTELNYGIPPTLTFTGTPVNTTSPDSPKAFTITNAGNADLIFPAPVSGNNPTISPSFTIDPTSTCPTLGPNHNLAFALHPTQSCTTAIDFLPTAVGPITGTVVRTDNNLNIAGSTQTVKLVGNGLAIAPTILFNVPNHNFSDPPFPVAATSNSPAPITYSVVSGPATIAGSPGGTATVTLTGAGTVTLQAAQSASGIYTAGSANATFQVAKLPQTITFAQPATPIPFSTAPVALNATASSGLPVVFTVLSGPARVSGSTLTVTGGGTIVVAADQPGNVNYAPAPEVTRAITVTFGLPTVTLAAAPNPVFLHNPVTLSAAVASPAGTPTGTVSFVDTFGAAAVPTPIGIAPIVDGRAVLATSALAVGTHAITAVYSGDLNFASLTSSPVVVLVEDFSLVITNPTLTIPHGGTGVYNFVVTSVGGAGLASTITLTTTGQPEYSTYVFAPAIIGAGSGTTQGTLTLHTPDFPSGPFYLGRLAGGGAFTLAALFAVVLPKRRRRRSLLATTLLLVCALASTTLFTGCGSGWKTQHWFVTVTATSGNLTRTAQATLTSQP